MAMTITEADNVQALLDDLVDIIGPVTGDLPEIVERAAYLAERSNRVLGAGMNGGRFLERLRGGGDHDQS